MAQPKSDPHHAPKAPHGASVSLDKITAALQAALGLCAKRHRLQRQRHCQLTSPRRQRGR